MAKFLINGDMKINAFVVADSGNEAESKLKERITLLVAKLNKIDKNIQFKVPGYLMSNELPGQEVEEVTAKEELDF